MAKFALRLIVGLGNPGEQYARTRHNAGYWLADELARRHGGDFRKESRHQGELARVDIAGEDLWLFKPTTFMNLSGDAVLSVAGFYRIAPTQMLVVHDELDLPAGVLRLKEGGGHGGHNGLRDCIAKLGDAFWRLRLGIGHPGARTEVVDYVLQRASAVEQALLDTAVSAAADIVPELIEHGAQQAMHHLHTRKPE